MIISDIKLRVGQEHKIFAETVKRCGYEPPYFRVLKKSLDARNKSDVKYVFSVEVSKEPFASKKTVVIDAKKIPTLPIVVVGSGPAGLFCAIKLCEYGFKPIVVERGDEIDKRISKIEAFARERLLDPDSNVQFGEGGAGTFSDGKLNTNTHDGLIGEVLETFVNFGAPEEIKWLNKPHIGTDKIRLVVKNMREYLRSNGCEVRFNSILTDLEIKDGKAIAVKINGERIEVSDVVIAIGHSARDTFEMLYRNGVRLSSKDFAVGVRVEHLQDDIGFAQYGKAYSLLPPADYKLVSHASNRAAFTFCMCPGGYVVPAASEKGGVVTNGMSNYARDGKNANSAVIVQVRSGDFGSSVFDGVNFQREIERRAFEIGGCDYTAPAQLLGDFLSDRPSHRFGRIRPTYPFVKPCDLSKVLPSFIVDALKKAFIDMDRRLRGFADAEAVLTAPETRTSSPVRIDRNERCVSVSVESLYPCGEGAGYAGGITSSATDGLRVASAIFKKYDNI